MRVRQNPRRRFVPWLIITLGSAVMALSVSIFLDPCQIVPGGVTGLAMLLNHLTGLVPVGAAILLINLPLFALSWRMAGRQFLVRTMYGTLVASVVIDLTSGRFLPEVDTLMAAIFGGLLMGLGLGLVFSQGATTGGSDIAARLLKRPFPHMQIGRLMLGIDGAVIFLSAFVFGVNHALYAAIAVFVSASTMDYLLYGLGVERLAYVISDQSGELAQAIQTVLSRGVTLLHGEGGYSGTAKNVILCAVKRQQIAQLKELIQGVDPNAFFILTEAHEVLGEGFRDYDKDSL